MAPNVPGAPDALIDPPSSSSRSSDEQRASGCSGHSGSASSTARASVARSPAAESSTPVQRTPVDVPPEFFEYVGPSKTAGNHLYKCKSCTKRPFSTCEKSRGNLRLHIKVFCPAVLTCLVYTHFTYLL